MAGRLSAVARRAKVDDRATQPARVRAPEKPDPMPGAHVYILASRQNGTLYIGLACDLGDRLFKHRNGTGSKFVSKYSVTLLVYYEWHPLYVAAIQRETNIKRWKRAWKIALIESVNPDWIDLTETVIRR